jgi:hypothetical protein
MGIDDGHDGVHALVERRMRRIGHQFVVLDKINSGLSESLDERGGLYRSETDTGLNDGADKRTAFDRSKTARAGDAKLRAAKMFGEGRGQFEIEQLKAGELFQFVEVSLNRGDERRKIMADIFKRPGDNDFRPVKFFAGFGRAGKRRLGDGFKFGNALDAGFKALAQFGGFARHLDESTGGLLAREACRGARHEKRRLNQIGCKNAFHGVSYRNDIKSAGTIQNSPGRWVKLSPVGVILL